MLYTTYVSALIFAIADWRLLRGRGFVSRVIFEQMSEELLTGKRVERGFGA